MGLFESLGFVTPSEDEEEQVEQVAQEETQEEQPAVNSAPTKSSMTFAAPSQGTIASPGQIIGKVNDAVYTMLSEAIERNNLEGNDFLEFMQALNGMASLAVDENVKFNMVFTTLGTSANGMTKEHLLGSIKHYLGVIENEKNIFTGEMASATESMVTANISNAESLNQTAQQKFEQIQQLQADIENINGQVDELNKSAKESEVKIAQKEADFEMTVGQLVTQLQNYDTKINQYIK